MYVIQSLASKRFYSSGGTWRVNGYDKYTEQEASNIIKENKLKNVMVILDPRILSTKDFVITTRTENKETRWDKNFEFIKSLQKSAKKFKMESVGVKSLDNAVVNTCMYNPIKHVSNRELYCQLPERYEWFIVEYQIASPGRIAILNYYKSKTTPELEDKIALVKTDYNKVIEKITISELKNINKKKHDRADTLVVDNPHMLNKNIQFEIKDIKKLKPAIQSLINQFNKHVSLLMVNGYEVFFYHVKKGVIHIDGYKKSNKFPEHLQKVAHISTDRISGISTLTVNLWGTRKGIYKNMEGEEIETEIKEYVIENPHELI